MPIFKENLRLAKDTTEDVEKKVKIAWCACFFDYLADVIKLTIF